jgi:hypothetical protein
VCSSHRLLQSTATDETLWLQHFAWPSMSTYWSIKPVRPWSAPPTQYRRPSLGRQSRAEPRTIELARRDCKPASVHLGNLPGQVEPETQARGICACHERLARIGTRSTYCHRANCPRSRRAESSRSFTSSASRSIDLPSSAVVPLWCFQLPAQRPPLQHADTCTDRREVVTQIVGEHREQLVGAARRPASRVRRACSSARSAVCPIQRPTASRYCRSAWLKRPTVDRTPPGAWPFGRGTHIIDRMPRPSERPLSSSRSSSAGPFSLTQRRSSTRHHRSHDARLATHARDTGARGRHSPEMRPGQTADIDRGGTLPNGRAAARLTNFPQCLRSCT